MAVIFAATGVLVSYARPVSYILKLENTSDYKSFSEKKKLPSIQAEPVFKDLISAFEKKNNNRILSSESERLLKELSGYYMVSDLNAKDIAALRNTEGVASLTPNYIFTIDAKDFEKPNDEGYKNQWALKAVKADSAWNYASGEGVLVGVIDTGIDYEHPDLKNSLWINTAEDINQSGYFENWNSDVEINGVSGDLNGIDDDGNGFTDDVIGYDFVDQLLTNIGDYSESDPEPNDENGHGTVVSGIIAAEANNSIGITGLAFDAKIISLRAFDASGNGESDDIARSIIYAVLNGAKVLNFSFGEPYLSPIVYDAIKFAWSMGCVMAASSGNSNSDDPHYPSDHQEVISTGSADESMQRAFRSNYGSFVRLTAPGQEVLSTDINGSYRTASGTSMAAPHVSAAAALLLEKYPGLSPADINGILQASASDIEEPGWDIYTGSGLLNLERAFKISGHSDLEIKYPAQDAVFNKNETEEISLAANIATPLFESWQVFIGTGSTPEDWYEVSEENFEQTKNDTIARIQTDNLIDTVYTARILIKLRTANTIERRVRFHVFSKESPLIISDIRAVNAWYGDRRSVLFSAKTNQPSSFSVMYRPKGSTGEFKTLSEVQRHSGSHFIFSSEEIAPGIEMEGIAIAKRKDGFTAADTFSFTRQPEAAGVSDFIQKSYSMPLAYILNEAADIYSDGQPAVVVNDISRLYFGSIQTYKFDGNDFVKTDDAHDEWIPVGIGDSNGDGIKEIFATASYKSILYQGASQGSNPFSGALLNGLIRADFWGESLFDIDSDGREELIAYTDSAFIALKYIDGAYVFLDDASLDTTLEMLSTAEDAALGDFDNDGLIELCHGDRYGNVYFFEFSDGKFTQEYIYKNSGGTGANYFCSVDIEGDGIPEVLYLTSSSAPLFQDAQYTEPVWKAMIFKSAGLNVYQPVWEDIFYGVREGLVGNLGFSYKNGIAAGDVDGRQGEEIVISVFPNLYIFRHGGGGDIKPLWWYPSAYANSALIYDFDGNGINEIGFGTFSDTKFFEYGGSENMPPAPAGFEGWAVSEHSAYMQWNEVKDADSYRILRVLRENNEINLIEAGETSETNITISGLEPDKWYEFTLVSIDNSLQNPISNPVYSIDVFTHAPIFAESVEVIDSRTLNVNFSGRLPENPLEPGNFIAMPPDNTQEIIPQTAAASTETSALLTFDKHFEPENYKLTVLSFRDKYGTPSVEKSLEFVIQEPAPEETELYLTKLTVLDGTTLRLRYSEAVTQAEAENTSNYFLSQGGEIENVVIDQDDKSFVTIYLKSGSGLIGALGKNYFLTVRNVSAESGNKMTTGPGSTLGFVFSAKSNSGAFVYPNPVLIKENPVVYFANVSSHAEITIMDLNGGIKKVLKETDSNGGVEWDGRDKNGNFLNSGIYLFKVKDLLEKDNESGLKKFVIRR